MSEGAYLYVLWCADQSFYVGTTRTALELRVAQHNAGSYAGVTATRRPVKLAYSEWFENVTDAIAAKRKLEKWTRAKKEAFGRGDWQALGALARRRRPHPSRRPSSTGSSG
jgi:putative endonuclease